MALNLAKFAKDRLKQLQNDAVAVKSTVNRDVVAPVSHAVGNTVNAGAAVARPVVAAVPRVAAQVNMYDNGRTYQHQAPTNTRSVIGQLTHNGVTNIAGNLTVKPVVTIAKGTKDWAAAGARSVYDIGRGAAASGDIPFTSPNKVALDNAHRAQETDFHQFLPSRQLAQLAETILHPMSQHSVTATSADDRKLFGTAPINNIQKETADAFNATEGKNLPTRLKTAATTAALNTVADVGSVYGAKGAGKTLTHEIAPVVGNVAGKTAQAVREANITPLAGNEVGAVGKNVPQAALAKQAKEYFADVPKATADYQAHTMEEFGTAKPNVVSADSAKFVVNGGKTMNPSHSAGFHEPASIFAKDYYKKLLDDPTTKDQPVLITGGGAGSGKTSGLALLKNDSHKLEDYAAINDTNLTSLKSAEGRIQPALDSGRKVRILYTFRDPIDSFRNGVLPRANHTGRLVPINAAAETHAGSLDTIKKLVAKYKDNPNVDIQIADNSLGKGKAALVTDAVDFLKNKSYNKDELTKALQNELQQATSKNEITPDIAAAYKQLGAESRGKSEHQDSPAVSKPVVPRPTTKTVVPDKLAKLATKPVESKAVTTVKPVSLTKRSAKEDAPIPLKDALAAKQAKLDKLKVAPKSPAPAKEASKPLPTSGKPTPGDAPSTNAGKVKDTRFTSKTVQKSDEVSPEVKGKTEATYTSDTMKGAAERAKADMETNPKSLDQTLAELNTKRGTASRDTIAKAIEHAKAQDALGTEAGQTMAAKLYDLAGEHGSAHGQSSQILAAIARKSPAGLRNKAFRDLKENGIDVGEDHAKDIAKLNDKLATQKPGSRDYKATKRDIADLTDQATKNKAIKDEIQGHIDTISKMEDGPEKDFATAVMQKAVAKHLPQSATEQAISVWKAGLLSGTRTHSGNIVSNTTFGVLKKASDPLAATVDKGLSLITGKRTKTNTGRGIITGTKESAGHIKTTLKSGIDERNVGDKYEQHAELNTNNKLLKPIFAASNGVFRALGAEDQPTYYAALKNSLYDQAKADGLNQGLHGRALRDHMVNTVKAPTEKMVSVAEKEANKSVLAYDTFGSKAIQGIHKGIDNLPGGSEAGKTAAHAAVNILAPFVRVPSAFISRTVDFTPLGPIKEVVSQVAHGKFDQRMLSQAIGEGATGTGVIALGIALSQKNLISGDFPKNDQKEQARWKAEGITPNSVRIGNKWVSLNYMGPVGLLFNAGHKLEQADGESNATKAGQAIAGLGQGLLGQSFLQGFSGLSDAISDPERSAKSYINSQVSSLVPGAVNDVAGATDKYQRQANSVDQAVTNRIPGLREKNPVKTDVYGNKLEQNGQGIGVLNPTRPSQSLSNPVIKEVGRLHDVNPQDASLQVTPTPVGRTVTIDKKNITLTDSQRSGLQTEVGQATQKRWGELIKTDAYKAMDDNQKAAALGNIKTLATEDATRAYVVNNNIGTYSKPESSKAIALNQGTNNIEDLASSKATGGATDTISPKASESSRAFLTKYNAMSAADRTKAENTQPDYEYKRLQAQYDNNKAAGKLTVTADIKAKDAVAKAKVGATYDKNIRDLYSLSNDDLSTYLSSSETGVDKATLQKQILAYGDALADSGVVAKNKFRNSKGAVTLGQTSKTGSGRSKSFKTVSIPGIKNNPYKTSPNKKIYRASDLPKFTKGIQRTYKTAKLTTNINAKLRKA